MSIREILYRSCLEKIAPVENMRMRKGMGIKNASDKEISFELETLELLDRMGEATAGDLANRLNLRVSAVRGHLNRLSRQNKVECFQAGRNDTPLVYKIKKSHDGG